MRPLRYLYVLALVVWLGGLATAALVVAPTTFAVLQQWNASTGRMLAGQVFGAVLDRMTVIAYAATGIMFLVLTIQRVLGPRPKHYGVRVGLLALVFALTFYTGRYITPRIDTLQSEVGAPMIDLPATDARRIEFDQLHSLSTTLLSATMVAGLVLAGWETRE
jgi:uncharacterized membrane protein